jgi:hypothetical protein
MDYKKKSILIIIFSLIVLLFSSFLRLDIIPKIIDTDITVAKEILVEKRGP